MGFDRTVVEQDYWERIDASNQAIERLRGRRRPEVPHHQGREGHVIWMVEGLEQLLLYRIVALADGCTLSWNARNPLGATLCARAMLETVAMLREFIDQLQRLCAAADYTGIKAMVAKRTFGAKLAVLTGGREELTAIQVLNFVDKLARGGTRAREVYDYMSEICHPNFGGHHAMFADLDANTGTLRLNEAVGITKGCFEGILLTFRFVEFIEDWLAELASLTPGLIEAAAHQGTEPV